MTLRPLADDPNGNRLAKRNRLKGYRMIADSLSDSYASLMKDLLLYSGEFSRLPADQCIRLLKMLHQMNAIRCDIDRFQLAAPTQEDPS